MVVAASRAACTTAQAATLLFLAVHTSCRQCRHKQNCQSYYDGSHIRTDPSKHNGISFLPYEAAARSRIRSIGFAF